MLEQYTNKRKVLKVGSCREMIKIYSLSTDHLYKEKTSGHSGLSKVWKLQFIQRISRHGVTENATLWQKSKELLN